MSEPAPVLLCARQRLADGTPFLPGWTRVDGFRLPDAPWDLATRRLLCVGPVDGRRAAEEAVAAVARGAGLVVSLELTGDDKRRFLEDLERLGASPVATAPVSAEQLDAGQLDAEQAELLDALATGATLTAAAAGLHLSRRTAHRRLAAARQRLGVGTTVEAVAVWITCR